MKNPVDMFNDHFFRAAEELWEQSGARVVEGYEIEPGHKETVAFFDTLEIDTRRTTKKERPFKTLSGREIGTQTVYHVVMSDGVGRLATATNLNDIHRTDDVTLTRGAEWMTASGANSFAADHFYHAVVDTGRNGIHIGAAHTIARFPMGLDWLSIPSTFNQSLQHSLAKAAFTKQAIVDHIIQEQDGEFARTQVGLGGSMDKMEKAAERFYADQNGNPMEQEVTIAPCGLEDLTPDDWKEIVGWALTEGKALPKVLLERVRRGRLRRSIGSVSLNPNFWISAFIGNAPALASNEAGRIAEWLRYDSHGYTQLLSEDAMSSPDWALSSERYPNMYYDVKEGVHVDLGRVEKNEELHEIVKRYLEERQSHGGNIETINREYVYGTELSRLEEVA